MIKSVVVGISRHLERIFINDKSIVCLPRQFILIKRLIGAKLGISTPDIAPIKCLYYCFTTFDESKN